MSRAVRGEECGSVILRLAKTQVKGKSSASKWSRTQTEIDVGLQFVIIAWVPLNPTVPVHVPKFLPLISTDVHTGPALGTRPLTVIGWVDVLFREDELFTAQPAKGMRKVSQQKSPRMLSFISTLPMAVTQPPKIDAQTS
jgi:hypothetical protein